MADIFDMDGLPPASERIKSVNDFSDPGEDLLAIDEPYTDSAAIPPIPSFRRPSVGSSNSVRLPKSYEVDILSSVYHKQRKRTVDDFERLKCIGSGAFGKVILVRDRITGKLYAQKQLKKATIVIESKRMEQTLSERSILEAVAHPYIVKLYYALQDPGKVYLILEYAQGGELFSHLAAERMFSEPVTAFYTAQIICALTHLHNAGIIYRDLKPENCLLDKDGHILLTDFGLSKKSTESGTLRSILGTPEYMAPEILLGQEYDSKVDWWSLGALVFHLLTGNPPFTGNNRKRVMDKITKHKLVYPYYLTMDAKDLLSRLLRKDPRKRLCTGDLDKIKAHRFFRRLDWKQIESRSSELDPPIKPVITDPVLAENFDAEFTDQILSPTGYTEAFDQFQGFSYDAQHTLAGYR